MTENLLKVLKVAKEYHKGQLYGTKPYEVHLLNVLSLATELKCDSKIKVACLLHDTLEDTNMTYDELSKLFGREVANIVEAVTDEGGVNRKEKKRATYPKIRKNWRAVVVKILDRVSNIQSCIADQNLGLLKMYENEHAEMFIAVFDFTHPQEVFDAWELYAKYFNFEMSNDYRYHMEMKGLINKYEKRKNRIQK